MADPVAWIVIEKGWPMYDAPADVVELIESGGVHLTIPGDRVAALEDLRASAEEQVLPRARRGTNGSAWWLTGPNR